MLIIIPNNELYLPALLGGREQVSALSGIAGRGQPARRLRRAGGNRAELHGEGDGEILGETITAGG